MSGRRALWVVATGVLAAGCTLAVSTADLSGGDPGTTDGPDSGPQTQGDGGQPFAPGDAATPDADAAEAPPVLADWPLDEGSGTVVSDKSGRGHDATVHGASTWTADAKGAPASALTFTAFDDYVVIPASADFDRPAGARFSITAWMRADEPLDHDMFVSISYGDSKSAFGLELESSTKITYYDGNSHIAESNIPDVTGAWHHYAVVVDGKDARVYLDGKRVGSGVADDSPRTCTGAFIGKSNWDDHLKGAVDRVRIYGAALTDAQVEADRAR